MSNATAPEMARKVLHIDSSCRTTGSASREVSAALVSKFNAAGYTVVAKLEESTMLVNEIQSCDVVVIGAPVYNFGIPGVLKLWIDMVARVGLTFKYTATGPQGLCEGKKAFVVFSSGGTSMGAPNDWNSPYLKYILGFMGIDDVTFIDAGASMKDPESKQKALKQVEEIEV